MKLLNRYCFGWIDYYNHCYILIIFFRAFRRKRIFPQLQDAEYPEINIGMPIPVKVVQRVSFYTSAINFEKNYWNNILILQTKINIAVDDKSVKVQGTPVCGGSVLSRACVITNLSDIKKIQQGDILITHCTDIAWSPYFPLLSGVVTELGGLISHGAVVAREYGLPCVVGAKKATHIFQTGTVLLCFLLKIKKIKP